MESLRTVFRAVVMLVVIVIAYKGWQLYGPPVSQVKSLAVRALEWAKSAIDEGSSTESGSSALALDPRPLAPPLSGAPSAGPPPSAVMQAQALVPATDSPAVNLAAPGAALAAPSLSTPLLLDSLPIENAAGADSNLEPLFARLTELGARDLELAAWGSSGQLHRFSCRASFADSPQFNRHFEAIAAEPQAAVQDVLAKIEGWRVAQSGEPGRGTTIR